MSIGKKTNKEYATMKKYLFVFLLSLSSSLFGQDISVETQKYYVLANEWETDSVCNLVYTVKNDSSAPQVVLLTEDDVNSMPLKSLIKRKLMRRYGDFSIAFFLWDPNVENLSAHVLVPEYFIKILSPDESLNITLTLQNEDDRMVDSLFRSHVLISNLEDIEGNELFHGFKSYMNIHHLLYPYSSITLSWNQIVHWLDKQNPQSWSTYELVGCQVQIKVNPNHVQTMNDGHGPSYVLSTPKGHFVIADAATTEFDFNEYEIIKTDTINGIYSTYGVHKEKFYRKDNRPIGNKKSRCRIYYADVMAKDTCEFNRIMDNVIVAPR